MVKTVNRYTTSSHCVYNIGYHIIWCTKYRRKVLAGDIEERLKEILCQKAEDISCHVAEIEIMPDHVHVFVKSTPTVAPHFIAAQLKGFSSRILRDEFPSLRSRLPTLWTRSYYCESVGRISQETIIRYIEKQKQV